MGDERICSGGCTVDSCLYFDEHGKLNCKHEKYSQQDLRPVKPGECDYFETQLELVLRKGVYFIRNQINDKEVEFDREASAFSTEGSEKLEVMADKLMVRPKDVWAVSLAIPEPEVKEEKDKSEQEEASKKIKLLQVSRLIRKDFIAEEIYEPFDHSHPLPRFAVRYFNKDEIEFKDVIDLGEEDTKGRPIIYTPVFNDHVKKGMVILPRKPVACTIKEVVEEAMVFVKNGFDPCGKDSELRVLVLIPISSWILDKERPLLPVAGIGVFAAIIACRGPSGSGKNRLANLLRFLSYHPLLQLSTYRIPSLYRPLDIWKGTLIIDEADVKNTGETSQLIHFLNSRATGTPIGRQNPDSPSKCDAFDSFGQTIVTQRRHFDDNATEGRIVPYYCDVSDKKIPTLLTIEQILKGYDLQDKLLYIRLKYWDKVKIEKTHWIEGVSDHRLNSMLLPIMALTKFDNGLKEIVDSNITVLHEERRKLKAQSDDGVMINVLWGKIQSGLFGVHNTLYYMGAERQPYEGVDGEKLERITPLTTTLLGESLKRSSRDVRKILTSLNIAPENAPPRFRVGKRSYRGIFFELKKMEKRLREFVVSYKNNELYKELGIPVPDVPSVPRKLSGGLLNFASQDEKKTDSPESVSGTSGTSGTQIEESRETSERDLPSQAKQEPKDNPNTKIAKVPEVPPKVSEEISRNENIRGSSPMVGKVGNLGKTDAKEPKSMPSKVGKLSNMVTDFAVVECVDLKEPHVDLCAHCGKIEVLTKQIRTAGKKWAHVCKPCGEFFDGVVKKAERRE